MRTIIHLILFLFCINVNAQNDSTEVSKNEIFAELGGPSIIGSINYEYTFFLKGNWSVGGRFGIGTIKLKDYTKSFNPDLIVPIGVRLKYIIKRFRDNHLSASVELGNSTSSIVHLGSSFEPERLINNNGYASVGLKYFSKHRINIGIFYTPIIEQYKTFTNWGALSIGYSF